MIALLDTSQDLDDCAAEIGGEVGQLLTPLSRFRLRNPAGLWAIDNGAFSRFDRASFLSLLEREDHHRDNCLFVTVPDVVGSARRTLEVFEYWMPQLYRWKLALACQDGQEHLSIPWSRISAVFIGGSTQWKCGPHATQIIRAAQLMDKHVHVGRINSVQRWQHFEELGVDTADGTGLAQYSHMRKAISNRTDQHQMQWEPGNEMPV